MAASRHLATKILASMFSIEIIDGWHQNRSISVTIDGWHQNRTGGTKIATKIAGTKIAARGALLL